MDPAPTQALFQLAVVLRAAYPHRSSHDRRSALTVGQVVAHAERLMALTRPSHVAGAIWQPGR